MFDYDTLVEAAQTKVVKRYSDGLEAALIAYRALAIKHAISYTYELLQRYLPTADDAELYNILKLCHGYQPKNKREANGIETILTGLELLTPQNPSRYISQAQLSPAQRQILDTMVREGYAIEDGGCYRATAKAPKVQAALEYFKNLPNEMLRRDIRSQVEKLMSK